MRLFSYLACVIFVSLLAACASPQKKLIENGATPYTGVEVKELVTGKTEIWFHGAGYYSPDGTIHARWKGTDYTGKWSATKDGEICYNIALWGQIPCSAYFHDGDKLSRVWKSTLRTVSIDENYRDGNQVSEF
jgi:hypothetical protein